MDRMLSHKVPIISDCVHSRVSIIGCFPEPLLVPHETNYESLLIEFTMKSRTLDIRY
jgi:hypothetical protein